MSDQPAAKPAAKAKPPGDGAGGKKDNVFTHKIGPLPMIGWVAIVAIILVIWRMVAAKKQANSASTGTGAASTAAGTVPQFVNQTYTTVTAPPAPIIDEDHRHHPPHDDHRRHAASQRKGRHHPKHPDHDNDHGQGHDHDHGRGRGQGDHQGGDDQHGGGDNGGGDWQGGHGQGDSQQGGGQGDWQGGSTDGQGDGMDQGWRGAFTRTRTGPPSHESQRSGRGRKGH